MFFLRRLISIKIGRFFKFTLDKDSKLEAEEGNNFLNLVEAALVEWKIALNNFNFIIDPDLIDYNIYLIEAAEKKYMFLLNKAKKEKTVDEAVKITISKGDVV